MIELSKDNDAYLFMLCYPTIEQCTFSEENQIEDCCLVEVIGVAKEALDKEGRSIVYGGKSYAVYNRFYGQMLFPRGWYAIDWMNFEIFREGKKVVAWKKTSAIYVELELE